MTQESVKQRYAKCRKKTRRILAENYKDVAKANFPFDFRVQDPNGIKYIRVEIDAIGGAVQEAIILFKKKCPRNTIFEVRIFEKHKQKSEPYIL